MNKELIDRVWKYYLPKEFKEEVKKEYYDCKRCDATASELELEVIFGRHNLTSDAEGEDEMLCVSINALQHLYAENEERKLAPKLSKYRQIAECENNLLYNLFGSKCLPDELNEDNFAKTEPKYHKRDKVRTMKVMSKDYVGKVGTINCQDDGGYIVDYDDGSHVWSAESDLEPYTEPEEKTCTDTCTDDCSSQCKSQDFDRIVRDGFCSHNRLHIAAMAMQGIMANPSQQCVEMDVAAIANLSLIMADALLHEAEKGGKSNERV